MELGALARDHARRKVKPHALEKSAATVAAEKEKKRSRAEARKTAKQQKKAAASEGGDGKTADEGEQKGVEGEEEQKGEEETAEAKQAREASDKEELEERAAQREAYLHMRQVYVERLEPVLREHPTPDRQGLAVILNYQGARRATAFRNLYSTNIEARQRKVVRRQVLGLNVYRRLAAALPNVRTRDKLFYLCVDRVIAHVNRRRDQIEATAVLNKWAPPSDSFSASSASSSPSASSSSSSSSPSSSSPPPSSAAIDFTQLRAELIVALHDLVKRHQAGFGPSPLEQPTRLTVRVTSEI